MNKESNSDLLQNISKLSDGNVIKFLLGASEQGKFPPEISDCITKVVDYMNENEVRVDPGFRYSLNISLFRKDKYWIRTITDRVTGEILYETKPVNAFRITVLSIRSWSMAYSGVVSIIPIILFSETNNDAIVCANSIHLLASSGKSLSSFFPISSSSKLIFEY